MKTAQVNTALFMTINSIDCVLSHIFWYTSSENMNNDCDKDLGPAPLQNSVLAEETFDAVVNLNEKSTSSGGNAIIAQKKITEAVKDICDDDDSCVSSYLLQLRCCLHVLIPGFTALGVCSNLTRGLP